MPIDVNGKSLETDEEGYLAESERMGTRSCHYHGQEKTVLN